MTVLCINQSRLLTLLWKFENLKSFMENYQPARKNDPVEHNTFSSFSQFGVPRARLEQSWLDYHLLILNRNKSLITDTVKHSNEWTIILQKKHLPQMIMSNRNRRNSWMFGLTVMIYWSQAQTFTFFHYPMSSYGQLLLVCFSFYKVRQMPTLYNVRLFTRGSEEA